MSGEYTKVIFLFIAISTLLIVSLSFFIIWFIYQYKKKQTIYMAELENLKISYENTILKAKMEIQEQTFQHISREIHDNVGQKLSLAKLYLNTFNDNSNELTDTANIISDVLNDLRNLSRTLSSELVVSNGLLHAIESEKKYLMKTNLFHIAVEVTGDSIFLEEKTDLLLFRIIQESLQNIIKHSKADNIDIKLDYKQTNLIITITDNGVGYIKDNSGGQGLKNMEARAKLLGGYFNIYNNLGMGTIVKINIPINEN